MRLIDLYYRAFRDLRKHTQDDNNIQKLRKIISHANYQEDILTTIKYECSIKEDWIENIEEGLIYIEKAILEDRQFIRTEGEVIPIEKVHRVSKSSVEHLSKHSNLITREPKGEDLVPDKLYVVEKLNDYLVYENRFIYMLLCYLKDFIQMRLDRIKEKITSYQSSMSMNKELNINQRHLHYKLEFNDLYKEDPMLIEKYKLIPLVDRIEKCYAITVSLLAKPLMKEVAKAPLIKPPVVKTNVIRMNPNFRAALKLYDYVTSYNEDGYTFKEIKKTFNPFPEQMSDEIAETIQLTTIISYIVGNGLNEILEQHYNNYEKEIQEALSQKMIDEIKRLKKKITEMNEDPEVYILMLEKRNAELEKQSHYLKMERENNILLAQEIEKNKEEIQTFTIDLNQLKKDIFTKNLEIDQINQKHLDDLLETELVHNNEIESIKINFENLLEKQKLDYEELISQGHQKMMEFESTISTMKDEIQTLVLENEKIVDTYQNMISDLKLKMNALDEETKYTNAKYMALKAKHELIDHEDFTSEEKFKQMELEMIAYKKFFKEQWKKTKYKIREKVKEDTFKISQNSDSDDSETDST